MPVPVTGRAPDHITGANFDDRFTLTLCPAAAGSDDQGLAERMGVPVGPRSRFECDTGARDARGLGRVVKGIDADGAGEPFGRTAGGRLGADTVELHSASPEK